MNTSSAPDLPVPPSPPVAEPLLHPLLSRQLHRLNLDRAEANGCLIPPTTWRQLLQRVSRAYDDADRDRYTLERSIDISGSEMVELYQQLRSRADFTRAIVDNAADAILTVDAAGRISSFNIAAERMFGWSSEEIVGRPGGNLLAKDGEIRRVQDIVTERLGSGSHVDVATEVRGRHRDGTVFPMMMSLSVDLVRGELTSTVIIRDISDQKSFEAQLRFQAGHDAMTGLPNRARFHEILNEALGQADPNGGDLALLFCDLDRFKLINDSLGHSVGDTVLIEAAQRFRLAVRSADVVARLSGDEFVVLCPRVRGLTEARAVAEGVVAAFADPFSIDGQEIVVSVSVGVVGADISISGEDMLRKADLAMYAAKRAGRSRVQVYETGMVSLVTARLDIENGLRTAIRENELVLHYQPIVRFADRRITKVEALVRWERPGHGLISPGMFLSVAEEAGLAPAVDRWVLETACAEAATWPSDVTVSVNLSERLLSQIGVIEMVTEVMERTGLPPTRLGIEVTEHLLGRNVPEAVRALEQLRGLGVGIYLDDFGTEYSSLSRLRQLELDVLKIDQSFVADLHEPSARVIVSAIITMAHGLRLEVVAEGVETDDQLAILGSLGCDAIQGYLLYRPLTRTVLQALLGGRTVPGTATG